MAQLKLIKQVNCKLRCYIWGNVVGTYPLVASARLPQPAGPRNPLEAGLPLSMSTVGFQGG